MFRNGNLAAVLFLPECETNIIMKNLVTIQEAKAVTSSLQVSQVFGKNHQHVIRDVENLKKDVSNFGQMYVESSYLDSYNRKQRMYIINRDGFTLLAMGFTGKKALQFKIDYINAFNKMEEYIKNQQKPQIPSQPSPHGKYRRKRVETYMPADDVLRLQIASYKDGYNSIYQLLQTLVYGYLNNMPYSITIQEHKEVLETERKEWKQICSEFQNTIDFTIPFIKELNATIAEKNTLIEKYQKQIKLLKEAI